MRKFVTLIAAVLVMLPFSATVAADQPDEKDGVYQYNVKTPSGINFLYTVDSRAQMCFLVISGGATVIPCESLAKRQEWKPIITWIK